MENLKKELQQAIMERFKQGKIASALEKELAEHTENITLEKYKGKQHCVTYHAPICKDRSKDNSPYRFIY